MATKKNKTDEVNHYMDSLDHSLKDGVQVLREAIKSVHPGITEEVKRRMAYFADIAEVNLKKAELERVVAELVKMMDAAK